MKKTKSAKQKEKAWRLAQKKWKKIKIKKKLTRNYVIAVRTVEIDFFDSSLKNKRGGRRVKRRALEVILFKWCWFVVEWRRSRIKEGVRRGGKRGQHTTPRTTGLFFQPQAVLKPPLQPQRRKKNKKNSQKWTAFFFKPDISVTNVRSFFSELFRRRRLLFLIPPHTHTHTHTHTRIRFEMPWTITPLFWQRGEKLPSYANAMTLHNVLRKKGKDGLFFYSRAGGPLPFF